MSLAYHGNYCGPGWSAGAFQQSVKSSVKAIDPFDTSCQKHDAAYATAGEDLATADLQFAGENIGLNPKRLVAGLAVGMQGLARKAGFLGRDNHYQDYSAFRVENPIILGGPETTKDKENMAKKRNIDKAIKRAALLYSLQHPSPREDQRERAILDREMAVRTKRVKSKAKSALSALRRGFGKVAVSAAPVSIGTTVTASKPVTKAVAGGVIVTGREFFGSVDQSTDPNWQLASMNPVHPAFYPASVLGNTARMYQYYRFRRLVIHYVTKEPTSNGAEIVLVYCPNILEPAEDGSNAQFLPRVMTRGHAVMGPLWQNHSMEVPVDGIFRKVDAFNAGVNFNDNVNGEVQTYVLGTANRVAGYLLVDYDIEFKETMITPHTSQIPIPSGSGSELELVVPASTANFAVLANTNTILGTNLGQVFRFVVSIDQSTFGAGTTASNAWSTRTFYHSDSTTFGAGNQVLNLVDGMQFFLVTLSGGVLVYLSLEGAIAGNASQQVFVNTTSTTATTIVGRAYKIRFTPQELAAAD